MVVSKKNESTQAAVDKVDKGGSSAVARNLETRPVGRAHHDQPQTSLLLIRSICKDIVWIIADQIPMEGGSSHFIYICLFCG